jgi:hypothetical protein
MKLLAKDIPDFDRTVGTGVMGGYLAIYAVKRTSPWVEREVVEKILAQFPKENEGSKTQIAPQQAELGLGGVKSP